MLESWLPRRLMLGALLGVLTSLALADESLQSLVADAEAGNTEAQFTLGNRYLSGDGVSQDNFEALRWLTLAAESDNANAQYNIAVMYLNGLGVVKDQAQAVAWFVRAAENGDTPSQYTLAVLLFNGQLGVPRNVPQAYKWFTLAGAAGHQEAAANAVLVQELLPANEVEAMQAEARAWIESFNQRDTQSGTGAASGPDSNPDETP
ncbi:MAG: tetratricopeptide repeat protein [Pseudohongiella sp.]